MKTRNTLTISYDTDTTDQNGLYLFDLREDGQSVYLGNNEQPNINVEVANNENFTDAKQWPASIYDGQLQAGAGDFPFSEDGEYYLKIDRGGIKYPSSGYTTLTIGAQVSDKEGYDMRPELKGEPGTGIKKISANQDILTIVTTDGKTNNIKIPTVQGPAGAKGKDGAPGVPGPGIKNVTYNDGRLSFEFDDGSSKSVPVPAIKGDQGSAGPAGAGIQSISDNGNSTVTIFTTDGQHYNVDIPTVKGADGQPGKPGATIQSITENGNIVTFHFSDGNSQSLTVPTVQGATGEAGLGIASIDQTENNQITIKLTNGQTKTITVPTLKGDPGEPGPTGETGPAGVSITGIRQGSTSISNNQAVTNIIITLSDNTEKTLQITTPGGPQGPEGEPGPAGRGVASVEAADGIGELTFKFSDGTNQTVKVPTIKGDQGPAGKDGESITGPAGKDGDSITDISADGSNLDIKTTSNEYHVAIPTVKGDQGKEGPAGPAGAGIKTITTDGKGLITITTTDGKSYNVTVPTVIQSPDGSATKNIYITDITQDGNVITVKLNDGDTKTFTIPTLQGPAGRDGKDGVSITGPQGPAGADGIGIKSIMQSGQTLTITTTNGNVYPFTIPTLKGDKGEPGIGIKSIVQTGSNQLTVNFSDATSSTFTIPTIQGPAGKPGIGIDNLSAQGQELTVNLTDGSKKTFTIPAAQGKTGDQGPAGVGLSGNVSVATSKNPNNIHVVLNFGLTNGSNDTVEFDVPKGEKGDKGDSITGPKGVPGEPGPAGKDGRAINSVTRDGNKLIFKIDDSVISSVELPIPDKFVTDLETDSSNGAITITYNTGNQETSFLEGLINNAPDVYSSPSDNGYQNMVIGVNSTSNTYYQSKPYDTEPVAHQIAQMARSNYVDDKTLYIYTDEINMYFNGSESSPTQAIVTLPILNSTLAFIGNLKLSGNAIKSFQFQITPPFSMPFDFDSLSSTGMTTTSYSSFLTNNSLTLLNDSSYKQGMLGLSSSNPQALSNFLNSQGFKFSQFNTDVTFNFTGTNMMQCKNFQKTTATGKINFWIALNFTNSL